MLAVPHEVRNANAAVAITAAARFSPPMLAPYPLDCPMTVVGYGPSLEYTWRAYHGPVMTVSGAHRFMLDQGVSPAWHVECDPRYHKVRGLGEPNPETEYLFASCVHPKFWELPTASKRFWHKDNGPESLYWIQEHDRLQAVYGHGLSSVGLCAIELAYAMGWRRILVLGLDACLLPRSGALCYHAGPSESEGPRDPITQMVLGGRLFRTTETLARQLGEFKTLCARLPGASIEVLGNGLLAHAQREKLMETA